MFLDCSEVEMFHLRKLVSINFKNKFMIQKGTYYLYTISDKHYALKCTYYENYKFIDAFDIPLYFADYDLLTIKLKDT